MPDNKTATILYAELKTLIEGMGYDVEEGDFVRKDGKKSHVLVFPRDPERIARHVVWAFDRKLAESVEPAHRDRGEK